VLPFTAMPVEPLLHAAREAQRVADLFPASRVLTGAAADERSFKQCPLDRCDILHIAAHGWADDTEVRRSFILLDEPLDDVPGAPPEDGLLQWHEAAALPLRASLVTLASCRSADGVLAVGEGVTGLTQAFLDAGATSVLAAQSDVPDWLSRRITETFYVGLRRGLSAAAALREAQREVLTLPEAADGFRWAGFVLVGDGAVTALGSERDGGRTIDGEDGGINGRGGGRTVVVAAILVVVALAASCVISVRRRSKVWRQG
jgi:CHAT domain-containing protein